MGDIKKYVIKMWGMILKSLGTTARTTRPNMEQVYLVKQKKILNENVFFVIPIWIKLLGKFWIHLWLLYDCIYDCIYLWCSCKTFNAVDLSVVD